MLSAGNWDIVGILKRKMLVQVPSYGHAMYNVSQVEFIDY